MEDRPAAREVLDAYAHAVDRADGLRRRWRELGEPAIAEGSRGAIMMHPLVVAIERTDDLVRRLAHELALTPDSEKATAKRGRPPGRDPIAALGLGGLRAVK